MNASETSDRSSGKVILDNRRTPCAVGLIRASRTMADLEPGTVLEIWSRDRFAPMEVRLWAEKARHRYVQLADGGKWPFRYFVFHVTKSTD